MSHATTRLKVRDLEVLHNDMISRLLQLVRHLFVCDAIYTRSRPIPSSPPPPPPPFLVECTDWSLRLVGGRESGVDGRLEVCLSNQWGTVSGTNWNDKNTGVVCRQLNATFSGECYVRAQVVMSNGTSSYVKWHRGSGSGVGVAFTCNCVHWCGYF